MDEIIERITAGVNTLSCIVWDNLPDGEEELCEQTKCVLSKAEKEIRDAIQKCKEIREQFEAGTKSLLNIITGGEADA